ncbi:MAG: M64 family metallopeptidase [Holophagae bacterium]|jgi:hypothetical protein
MARAAACALILLFLVVPVFAGDLFDADFVDATLRIDYFHTGDADREMLALDRLYRQGAWAGSRTHRADRFRYGGYQVEVRDAAAGTVLYSRGFDSYFGEYRTTGPAADGVLKTYHETVLVPFPKRAVQVTFTARRRNGTVETIGEFSIDPQATEIAGEPPAADAIVVETHIGGPPHLAADFVFVGEGYTSSETERFKADLAAATERLLRHEPFAANRKNISVRGVLVPSHDSGSDEPTRGLYRDTAVGTTFNSLGSERYLLTEDNRRLRDIAANVPYDSIVIMVNHERYGGGGIYNLFCTFTAGSEWAEYLLLHELGHSFAGLADEYYSSDVAYNDFYPKGVEPVEPNISALLSPLDVPWTDLMTPDVPMPTPWEKQAFDERDAEYQAERRALNQKIADATRAGADDQKLAALRAQESRHAREHSDWVREYLGNSKWAGKVGGYEGAGYSSTGLYRPFLDCLMFSRRMQPYCPVCERSVEQMIRFHSK